MRFNALLASTSLVSALACLTLSPAQAQTAAALSGQVSSAEEAAMEGVLVSAKREGSNITTTVVSNDKGQFSFPADRLEPGHYNISIRAAGYSLAGPKAVDIAGRRGRDRRHQAREGQEPGQPALQHGVAAERARRRQDQVLPARLRRLPHPQSHLHVDA